MWLGVGNALLGLVFIALTYFFILPNCPGDICDQQIEGMTLGVVTTFVSANFTAISLYFAIRFWRR